MTDPFLDTLATALANQAATGLTSVGKKALDSVRSLLTRKLHDDPDSQRVLEAADDRPEGHHTITALAERLDEIGQRDPEFAAELRRLGEPVTREVASGDVTNTISGHVHGNVVQARDVHGDINLG